MSFFPKPDIPSAHGFILRLVTRPSVNWIRSKRSIVGGHKYAAAWSISSGRGATPCTDLSGDDRAQEMLLVPPAESNPFSKLNDGRFCEIPVTGHSERRPKTGRHKAKSKAPAAVLTSGRTLYSGTGREGVRHSFTGKAWCARRELNPHAITDPGF